MQNLPKPFSTNSNHTPVITVTSKKSNKYIVVIIVVIIIIVAIVVGVVIMMKKKNNDLSPNGKYFLISKSADADIYMRHSTVDGDKMYITGISNPTDLKTNIDAYSFNLPDSPSILVSKNTPFDLTFNIGEKNYLYLSNVVYYLSYFKNRDTTPKTLTMGVNKNKQYSIKQGASSYIKYTENNFFAESTPTYFNIVPAIAPK
jgi:hypothetical protein